jgi:hypothetical protein
MTTTHHIACVTLTAAVLAAVTSAADLAQDKALRVIEDGVLDRIELFVPKPPDNDDAVVVIRTFTADTADLGTGGPKGGKDQQAEAATMQTEGPKELAAAFVEELERAKVVKAVRTQGDGNLVIEGKFTEINPGSRAKRYWVGFGAGKSAMAVDGTVRDGSGNLLARFKQRRIAAMGMMGGDSLNKMKQDSRNIGEDLAKFVRTWLTGRDLG